MPVSFAEKINSVYETSVPVASQSADDKVQAEQKALAQVFIKVSGNDKILDKPEVKDSIDKAEQLLQEYSYSPSPTTPATPYLFNAKFDKESINRALRNADVQVWGQNRPMILAWIEYEIPSKPAVIIDSDSPGEIQTLIKKYSDQRGLPFILPIMDVTDMDQVGVNDIAMMSLPSLLEASKRYHSDIILIARIFKDQKGFTVQAKMVVKEQQWEWSISGKTLDNVIATLMNTMGDTLAGRYAAFMSKSVESQITLKVVNITQDGDFARLIQYLNHLTQVADVEPIHVAGNEALLKVSLRTSKDVFVQVLSVGNKLQSTPDSTDAQLSYQWNPLS